MSIRYNDDFPSSYFWLNPKVTKGQGLALRRLSYDSLRERKELADGSNSFSFLSSASPGKSIGLKAYAGMIAVNGKEEKRTARRKVMLINCPSHLPFTATIRHRAASLKTSAESVKKSLLFKRSEFRDFSFLTLVFRVKRPQP